MRAKYKTAIVAELTAARDIAAKAENEDRELSDVERDTVNAHLGKVEELKAKGAEEAAMFQRMEDLTSGIGIEVGTKTSTTSGAADLNLGGGHAAPQRKSLGKAFVESPEFKGLLQSAPDGRFSEKMRVNSAPVSFKTLLSTHDRETGGGIFIRNDYRGALEPYWERPLSVRGLFAQGSTNSDTIEYIRQVSVTNNAQVVPEAVTHAPIDGTDVTAAEGGLKPESGMVFERTTTVVRTIAHWMPITKKALSDAGQLRSLIDQFLLYGLEEAFEDELLAGDGTGEHFTGLLNTSGVQTQAAPGAGQTIFDTARIARRKVRIGGRTNPTAYVLNPIDWEKYELMKDGNEQYFGAGPFALTAPRLWGLPVIESEALPVGTGFVANWNQAIVFDREQASIQATDSHADFFIRNLVAILAEMRAAFAVLRPPAFCKFTIPA